MDLVCDYSVRFTGEALNTDCSRSHRLWNVLKNTTKFDSFVQHKGSDASLPSTPSRSCLPMTRGLGAKAVREGLAFHSEKELHMITLLDPLTIGR
jgi:hypothetical protein